MIEWLVFWALYLLPAFAVYRRAGYMWNERMLRGHEFSSICAVCNPRSRRTPYMNNSFWPFHPSSLFIAFPFALVWPLVVSAFAVGAVIKRNGGTFLKPPPVIETKEEKRLKKIAEAELELAMAERRLKELGVE